MKHLRESFSSEQAKELLKQRMIQWRKEPVTLRIEKPIRLDKARSVGYKAKEGFIVIRQRLRRGGRMRPAIKMGRRPKHYRHKLILKKSYRAVAEGRVAKAYPNLTVLNSYQIAKDGLHYWFEVICVDPQHANIKNSPLAGAAAKRGRVERGLTNAGKRGRGQKAKGKGHEKNFPSLNANKGTGN